MRHSTVYRRFLAWETFWHEQKIARQRFQQAMRRWRHKALHMSLQQWINHVENSKRSKQLSKRAMARWQHRHVVSAFSRWTSFVAERRHARRILKRFFFAKSSVLLSVGWRSLVEHTRYQRQVESHALRAIRRWRVQALTRVYNRWYAFTREVIRLRGISSRVIRKMKMRVAARAMSRLQDNCELRKRARWLVAKVIGRSKLMNQSKGMNTWVSAVRVFQEQDRQSAFLQSFVGRMMSRYERKELFLGINAWKTFITQTKKADIVAEQKAAEKRRLEQAKARITRRMCHYTQTRAWNAWLDRIAEKKRLKTLKSRATARKQEG